MLLVMLMLMRLFVSVADLVMYKLCVKDGTFTHSCMCARDDAVLLTLLLLLLLLYCC